LKVSHKSAGDKPVKPALLILLVLALPFASHAEKGQSIMFGDQDPVYTEKTRDKSASDQAEHCKQLRRQMDELKGKPQRRNAVVQRYRLECVQSE
jgi:thymidylate synthase